jgi:hypothetical protein
MKRKVLMIALFSASICAIGQNKTEDVTTLRSLGISHLRQSGPSENRDTFALANSHSQKLSDPQFYIDLAGGADEANPAEIAKIANAQEVKEWRLKQDNVP